jgi:ABC-type amino acid transport substrate-binding protein
MSFANKKRTGQNVKRRYWIALAVLAAVIAVGGWLLLGGLGGEQEDQAWLRIQRDGVLRVGLDASYPPFEFTDEGGQFRGFDLDLAAGLAQVFGVRLEIMNVGFDGLYDALKNEKFDMIVSALPYDAYLIKDFAFSYSYFNAGLRWVARADVMGGLANPDGKRVAVQLGSSADVEARALQRRFPGMAISTFDEQEQAEAALSDGAVDAVILDGVSALRFVQAHPGFAIGDSLLTDEPYVIAMPVDAPRLKKEVNAALVNFRESGQLDAWVRQWIGGE